MLVTLQHDSFFVELHIGICGYKISSFGYYGRKEGNDETTR